MYGVNNMRLFKRNTKGVCPECYSEIEDINDKFLFLIKNFY